MARTREPAAALTNPVALAKRAGCMLAGEDFISRRMPKDDSCREVIVRLAQASFVALVGAARTTQATPAQLSRSYIEAGLFGAASPATADDEAAYRAGQTIARLRKQLDDASAYCRMREREVEQCKADVTRLRVERDQRVAECEDPETLLNDEKIANAKLFSELCALKTEHSRTVEEGFKVVNELRRERDEARLEPSKKVGLPRRAGAGALPKAFVKAVVSYRYANATPDQIAGYLDCDVADVRRALASSGRRA